MNSEDRSDQFIDEIILDANAGRAFVPFVGSGLSSPSGIIMGMEFTNYLAFTTYLVLCDPKQRERTHGEGRTAPWDLHQQGWPPLPSANEVEQAKSWVLRQFLSLCKNLSFVPNYDGSGNQGIKSLSSKTRRESTIDELMSLVSQPPIPRILRSWEAGESEEQIRQFKKLIEQAQSKNGPRSSWSDRSASYSDMIVERGIRALADWRETLAFLASVRARESNPPRLEWDSLDSSIIDHFNAVITRDKRPNLGHKIIAHLSGPLRVSTILSTNFDTLTEDAYRALGLPITVLPVSSKGDLPHPRTVASCDALVKLHGEMHDTRADLSLDDEPTSEDKETFSAYMTRGTGHLVKHRRPERDQPRHDRSCRLLVVGNSGSDHRCVQMMKHWLETAPDDPRIYWVCFSRGDERRVEQLFASPAYAGRVRTVRTSRPDLLLYQVYQRLVICQPPGGLTYEFSHALPPNRQPLFDSQDTKIAEFLKETSRSKDPDNPLGKRDRRMLRDVMVKETVNRIKEAVKSNASEPRPVESSMFGESFSWLPVYRSGSADPIVEARKAELKHYPRVINSCGGVVRASAIAAEELSSQQFRRVFWFELQDYMDVDSLLRDLLRSLGLRVGQFQSRHVTMHPFAVGLPAADDPEAKDQEKLIGSYRDKLVAYFNSVLRDYRVDPSTMVVLFCGRDSYGNCSGLVTSTWQNKSHEFARLHLLIEVLGKVGIPTVYFPSTPERSERKSKLIKPQNKDTVQYAKALDDIRSDDGSRSDDDSRLNDSMSLEAFRREQEWPSDPWIEQLSPGTSKKLEKVANDLSVFSEIISGALSDFYDITKFNGKLLFVPRITALSPASIGQLEFIYALTLFRHSRPRDAISAEATFPCPHRFQAQALDNDFLRATRSEKWISDLRRQRVFFTKPGGALWMHRDIRLAIQSIIEQTDVSQIVEAWPKPLRKGSRHNARFLEIRGRLHFWIGDWYYKAFCASGHLAPIIESVYHLISSATYSRFAKPKQRARLVKTKQGTNTEVELKGIDVHRRMMFESAVVQASKVLLNSWSWIELWQASPADVGWLSTDHVTKIETILTETIASLGIPVDSPAESRLKKACEQFTTIHKSLGRAVKLEGGNVERGAWRNVTSDDVLLELHSESDNVSSNLPKDNDDSKLLLPYGIQSIRQPGDVHQKGKKTFGGSISAAMKGCGELAQKLWTELKVIIKTERISQEKFGRLKATWKESASPAEFRQFIWILGETAYLLLRRAKINFHATAKISNEEWLLSTMCCNLAIDLCKHLPASMLNYDMQSKIKLHTIYALGLSNLGRFYEANRHLTEAQAILSKRKDSSARDLAVISLRRAEVKLTECFWIGRFLDKETRIQIQDPRKLRILSVKCHDTTFMMPNESIGPRRCWDETELNARQEWHDVENQDGAKGSRRSAQPVLPPNIFECYRLAKPLGIEIASANDGAENEDREKGLDDWQAATRKKLKELFAAKLDEAVRSLEIAERNLGGVSQSNLWWSRLRTLQLRVYGLLIYLEEDADISIIFRKHAPAFGIFTVFQAAVRIAGEDDFRKLRALKYFLSARRWYCGFMERHLSDELRFVEAKPDLPDSMERHRNDESRSDETKLGLPDSMEIAIKIGHELKEAVLREGVDSTDLLRLSVKNCIESHPELGIDVTSL